MASSAYSLRLLLVLLYVISMSNVITDTIKIALVSLGLLIALLSTTNYIQKVTHDSWLVTCAINIVPFILSIQSANLIVGAQVSVKSLTQISQEYAALETRNNTFAETALQNVLDLTLLDNLD